MVKSNTYSLKTQRNLLKLNYKAFLKIMTFSKYFEIKNVFIKSINQCQIPSFYQNYPNLLLLLLIIKIKVS